MRRKQHACTAHVACMAASLARRTGSLRSVQPRPASRRARRCATSPRSLVAQVVDETDRLLRQSYQNWLPHVVAAAARAPTAAGLPAAAAAACNGAPHAACAARRDVHLPFFYPGRNAAMGSQLGSLVGTKAGCTCACCL